jgi:uncharacterized repeat protein (TIGR03803 family)
MAIAVGKEMKRGIIQRNRKCSVPLRAEGGIPRRSRFSVIGAVALLTACGGSRSTSFEAPIASEVASPASAYERVLYSFAGGNDGSDPASAPVMIDGTLYGTTLYGGGGSCSGYSPGCGIVYAIDGAGNERVLHAFQGGEDGATPNGPLVTVKGKLVGTTARGGGSECNNGPKTGCGTVFEITTSGTEHVLFRFLAKSPGVLPLSGLTSFRGALYGSTAAGGTGNCHFAQSIGCGVIFKMLGLHALTVIYEFKGGKDGAQPHGPLLFSEDRMYGTTSAGGGTGCRSNEGCGTAFSLTTAKTKTTLHEFGRSLYAGAFPESGLVLVSGAMYGTTLEGGPHDCVVTSFNGYTGCGTIFRILPSGKFQSIYDFTGGTDQAYPHGLTLVGDKLYGTTDTGINDYGCGTVFEITRDGHETTIYSFGGTNGCNPDSGLHYANHTLYGTTAYGGRYDDGTVFSITLSR